MKAGELIALIQGLDPTMTRDVVVVGWSDSSVTETSDITVEAGETDGNPEIWIVV